MYTSRGCVFWQYPPLFLMPFLPHLSHVASYTLKHRDPLRGKIYWGGGGDWGEKKDTSKLERKAIDCCSVSRKKWALCELKTCVSVSFFSLFIYNLPNSYHTLQQFLQHNTPTTASVFTLLAQSEQWNLRVYVYMPDAHCYVTIRRERNKEGKVHKKSEVEGRGQRQE